MAYLGMLGVVAAAGIAAFLVNRGDDGPPPAPAPGAIQETAPVSVAGSPLTPLPGDATGLIDPATDAAVGAAAPVLTGQSFDGSPVGIGLDGRAKVVVFLAHWCPHCRAEVPVVAAWLRGGGSSPELDWYSVSTSVDASVPNYPPSAWLASEGWSIPVLADSDDGAAAEAYGLSSFPYFVAVSSDGTVAARASGELTIDELDALARAATG
jgi:cytochrome c biogenesis protein CcmG, thiol:disulfide interchange protein DsbE